MVLHRYLPETIWNINNNCCY